MNPVLLIARREITTRIQQRGYRIGFGIALVVVVLACVLPSLFSGDDGPAHYDVGIATSAPGLPRALETLARAQGARVTVHTVSAADARSKVRDKKLDAAVLPGRVLIARSADSTAVSLVRGADQLAGTLDRLRAAGLTTAQATAALQAPTLTLETTKSSQSSERQALAVVAVVVLFSQLITFCTWVAMGVVEEKSSRVVELVLAAVRPLQLLAGKLLGIGALAAGQVLVIGVVGLVAATLSGTLSLPASGLLVLVGGFVGFVLGYAFFAALAAGVASTVSRQEEVSGVLAPITITIMICYFASFAAASNPDSSLARVLSIVPPVSSLTMPARLANGGVATLDVVLAILLLVLAAAGVTVVAARIYRASVLHSGSRVSLRRAWHGEAVGGDA
ncbi:ABC transporter permease [uncultured Jatrophihabitans sp.]|uniref:ABC transporter permease n=1 Tax=uncultured Jatrophihabitans sp. TaxID=1610747 RepID=UPI0035CB52D0